MFAMLGIFTAVNEKYQRCPSKNGGQKPPQLYKLPFEITIICYNYHKILYAIGILIPTNKLGKHLELEFLGI